MHSIQCAMYYVISFHPQTPVDCQSVQCKNQGSCIKNAAGQYYCACPGHFGGELCEYRKYGFAINEEELVLCKDLDSEIQVCSNKVNWKFVTCA